ncbi:c-type cytochrome [Cognataquiflexum rubidum]|uniref:c-type cytochrome n=1 Tax=Cognataquiflexum rubidum TaxID=2922273 RepID=UPI001F129020|nr:c-type cytochrome [Cognataquiflexum rubidum]MCH6236685.1 PQQ-dependent sugar dehydrogenase [Cognataquiflexum rubidum]
MKIEIHPMTFKVQIFFFCLGLWMFFSCEPKVKLPAGDDDNGGLFLPDGFEAVVVVDSIGRARHLAVSELGDIYVKLRAPDKSGRGIVGIRDTNHDGKADIVEYFGDYPDKGNYGTGMRIYNGYLYFSTAGEVYRYKMDPDGLLPTGEPELILVDDYKNGKYGYEHIAKPIAFDNDGHMYVAFGSPGDVCQEFNRKPESPGMYPCPQLDWHGGIWQFDADRLNQTQKDGKRYATGIRSVVAMDWNQEENELYVVQHGRDDFTKSWPELFSPWESAILPSEEFFRVEEGTDGGWPYFYFDHIEGKKKLNPEYGGDGKLQGDAHLVAQPLLGFPGHFAPNDLHFYRGDQFPERYKNGAFVAFHGSTIRVPYPQAGYFVAFVPFEKGIPAGPWEVFADGFAGMDTIVNTGDALARPMGIAMGPDGSLYISESVKGKIWRIMYKGKKSDFGEASLAKLEERKNQRINIKDPDSELDNLETEMIENGSQVYNLHCGTCHQRDGKGDGSRFPPINNSRVVNGKNQPLIELILKGLEGSITVNGVAYNGVMPSHSFLSDAEISSVLTYIRRNFGNDSPSISAIEVGNVRKQIENQ